MLQYSFKNITDEFEDFADKHYQINEYGFGMLSNISTKNTNYPLMWVMNITSRHNNAQFVMSFDVYFLELEKQDHSNLITIFDETLSIAVDFVSTFKYTKDYEIINDIVYEPWTGEFDDYLTGYRVKIDIEILENGNCENIPTE